MTLSDQETRVRISDLSFSGKFSLRCRTDDLPALEKALGITLPVKIGDMGVADDRKALCLGPDEWLILCDGDDRANVNEASAILYESTPHSLVDVSYRELGLEIVGPEAETLLSACCPRDLSRLADGRGTRTVFDIAQVVILRTGAEAFQIYVWRSFYRHVRGLMAQTEKEIALGL